MASSVVPPGTLPPAIRRGFGDHVTGTTLAAGLTSAGWDLGVLMRLGRLESTRPRETCKTPLVNCSAAADDGGAFWLLGLEGDRHWPGLAAIERPDLVTDERFASARGAIRARGSAGRGVRGVRRHAAA